MPQKGARVQLPSLNIMYTSLGTLQGLKTLQRDLDNTNTLRSSDNMDTCCNSVTIHLQSRNLRHHEHLKDTICQMQKLLTCIETPSYIGAETVMSCMKNCFTEVPLHSSTKNLQYSPTFNYSIIALNHK